MAIDYLAAVRDNAVVLATTARDGSLDAPVPSCPGWDVNRLLGHLGRVHRWATEACRTGAEPVADRLESPPRDATVLDWFEGGVGPLVDVLTVLDPDAHVWNFSNGHQDGRFWPRRMAIETTIHPWGRSGRSWSDGVRPIDAELASDGMDELLDVHVGLRLAGRDGSTSAARSTSTAQTRRASGLCTPTTAWRTSRAGTRKVMSPYAALRRRCC